MKLIYRPKVRGFGDLGKADRTNMMVSEWDVGQDGEKNQPQYGAGQTESKAASGFRSLVKFI